MVHKINNHTFLLPSLMNQIIFHNNYYAVGLKRPHPLELDNSEDDEGILIPSSQKRLREEEEGDDSIVPSLIDLRFGKVAQSLVKSLLMIICIVTVS